MVENEARAVDVEVVREFEGVAMRVRPWRGRLWVEARNLGAVLGYTDPRDVLQLVDRYAEDFVEGTDVLTLRGDDLAEWKGDSGDLSSPRGQVDRAPQLTLLSELAARMVAMLARTPSATRVRRWLAGVWAEIDRTGGYQHPTAAGLTRADVEALLEQSMDKAADAAVARALSRALDANSAPARARVPAEKARPTVDPWKPLIVRWIAVHPRGWFVNGEVLNGALGRPLTIASAMRVGNILRGLGYDRIRVRLSEWEKRELRPYEPPGVVWLWTKNGRPTQPSTEGAR